MPEPKPNFNRPVKEIPITKGWYEESVKEFTDKIAAYKLEMSKAKELPEAAESHFRAKVETAYFEAIAELVQAIVADFKDAPVSKTFLQKLEQEENVRWGDSTRHKISNPATTPEEIDAIFSEINLGPELNALVEQLFYAILRLAEEYRPTAFKGQVSDLTVKSGDRIIATGNKYADVLDRFERELLTSYINRLSSSEERKEEHFESSVFDNMERAVFGVIRQLRDEAKKVIGKAA